MLTVTYNLRNPHKKTVGTCLLYAIVRCNETKQQTKVPIGRVSPTVWDTRKKQFILGADKEDLVTLINKINSLFDKEFSIFAINDYPLVINRIREMVNNNSNTTEQKRRGITATKLLKAAFNELYPKETTKSGTYSQYKAKYEGYLTYLEETKQKDTLALFSQTALNAYKAYLIKKYDGSANSVNQYIQAFLRLVKYIVNNDTKGLGITLPTFTKLEDKRDKKENTAHFALTEDEINKLRTVELTNKDLIAVRDYALLQITLGYRVSDLKQILSGKYTKKNGNLTVLTQKEKVLSIVPLEISEDIERIINNYHIGNYSVKVSGYFDKKYNDLLKELFKVAKLDREIKYITPTNETIIKPMHEVITSHSFRVSGATNLLRKYGDKELVVKICGWSDTRMLDEIYSRLTVEDEIDNVTKLFAKAKAKVRETKVKDDTKATIDLYKEVLAMVGKDPAEWLQIDDLDEITRLVHNYENELNQSYGIDYKTIKELFNTENTLKEKRAIFSKLLTK